MVGTYPLIAMPAVATPKKAALIDAVAEGGVDVATAAK
jgi:hypothetical protein